MLANETENRLIRKLKECVLEEIVKISANILPSFCSNNGMGAGSVYEAMKSKDVYVRKRMPADGSRIASIASSVLQEIDSYKLSEALANYQDREKPQVTALTRRRIMAVFQNRPLSNDHDEMNFMRCIWPIEKMPSIYEGYDQNSLEDDILQHTVRNDDWTNTELLENLGLPICSLQRLFNFLEEAVHPTALDGDAQTELITEINRCLIPDGYSLTETSIMSGSPVMKVSVVAGGSPSDLGISEALSSFSPDQITERWNKALERRSSDTEAAITIARTLLEDVCKWILHEAEKNWQEKDDLPVLYRKLTKELNLAPDAHTEQIFKQILGGCQTVVESLGALRNKLGDAHSIGPRRVRPAPRHAELAVNLAGTMSTFLIETWKARQAENKASGEDG